jgi:hypothetical protein
MMGKQDKSDNKRFDQTELTNYGSGPMSGGFFFPHRLGRLYNFTTFSLVIGAFSGLEAQNNLDMSIWPLVLFQGMSVINTRFWLVI